MLDWLRGLDKEDRRAIGLDLVRVQFGWPIGRPLVGSLKDGLWELRSSQDDEHFIVKAQDKPGYPLARELALAKTENAGGYQMKKRNKHIGPSLEDLLKEEGVLEETRAVALKETLAWQVQQAMRKEKISKAEMARRMNTSRAALDRLLDPSNASVTLQTLTRAAHAIGRDLRIELV